MKLIECQSQENWDKFVFNQKPNQFLETWQWGKLQEAYGEKVRFFIFTKKDFTEEKFNINEIVAASLIITKKIPGGFFYFYSPRGPLFSSDITKAEEKECQQKIKELAKKEKVLFWRIEPTTENYFLNWSWRKSINLQPAQTLFLNLKMTEEELLKSMHQKTRYNINLALKKGVTVTLGQKEEALDFLQLMQTTGERDSFRIHPLAYYKHLVSFDSNLINFFIARYQNKILAAGIFVFSGDTVTYLHGASSNEDRNVMAPFLLQWTVIKKARDLGYDYYDFFGIDEKKWPGVTRFKEGFGGEKISYPGTMDVVFQPLWYNMYTLLRRLRRI
ncbi:MAG: aminoacyltransferase [Planctomycetes bacterium]|jgi:lipid II:glycine glycyltransferase (peptidoglycan interpeptide bridge formation enzyme)|nr:aminoacyltransferase [Planctomycetota bacterium]